jgi:flagellar protein FliS
MFAASTVAEQYFGTQVRSSSPLELVVMLYDAALRHATTAREAMARRDIPARRAALSRTLAIVAELQGSLDLDQGGDVARELDRLYVWMTDRLTDATVRQDSRPIDEVIRILDTLADAWRTIAGSSAPEAPR